MSLELPDVILEALIEKAKELGLDDAGSVSIGVWSQVPEKELNIFNLPQFHAVIKYEVGEIKRHLQT